MFFICGSSDAGAVNYFNSLKKYVDLTIVNRLNNIPNKDNFIYMTGAALGDSLDKKIIKYANKEGKKCVSVIEHWSWYRRRFELDGELLLPDFILLNDEIAYFDAIKDGLPENRLIIAGNPVLEALKYRKLDNKVDVKETLQKHNLPSKRIVVFISEELSSVFNDTQDDLGYDEFKVLDMIIKTLTPNDHLVIKLHPEETLIKYAFLESNNVTIIKNLDIFELDALADVVIGMASMLLLELSMLRNDVISFRPDATKEFIGDRLEATICVDNQKDLKKLMLNPSYTSGQFSKGFSGSGNRIGTILKELFL